MPIAGWIAARTMGLFLRDGGGLPPHAGDGLSPSIASRAELAPAFRRSRRESGRPMAAAHWSTWLSISTSDFPTPYWLSAESPHEYGSRARHGRLFPLTWTRIGRRPHPCVQGKNGGIRSGRQA